MTIHYTNINHQNSLNAVCGAVGLSIVKTDDINGFDCGRCERVLKKKDVWDTDYGKIYFKANRQTKHGRTERGID